MPNKSSGKETKPCTVRFRDAEQISTIKKAAEVCGMGFGEFCGNHAEAAAVSVLKAAGKKTRVVVTAPGANASAV